MNILGYTHDRFVEEFQRRYAKRAFYSSPIYRQVMKAGKLALGELDVFSGADELARQIESELVITAGKVVQKETDGGVLKFVTELFDGLTIESVVIPMFNRHTLCVSSQVGCRMGCRFCRTGKMGLIRSLEASEIVEQVFAARHLLGADIRNVVFMGMGEPLDNLENVVQAVRVLEDQRGMDIARRYITISTVGLVNGIDRLAGLDGPPLNLAVSLNAPNDEIRSRLMPINRTYSMSVLKEALTHYPLGKKTVIFVEYVLIRGINDQPEHARALSAYLSPLKVKVNLIPYNPDPGSRWLPPSDKAFQQFRGLLEIDNVFVRQRHGKGEQIMAACGQLGARSTSPA